MPKSFQKSKKTLLSFWSILVALRALVNLLVALFLFINTELIASAITITGLSVLALIGVYFVWTWNKKGYYVALTLLILDIMYLIGALLGTVEQSVGSIFMASLLELLWVYEIRKKLTFFN